MLVEENNRGRVLTDLPAPGVASARDASGGVTRMDVEEADTFDEPEAPAVFDAFLASRPSTSTEPPPKPTSRKRPEGPPSTGPMAKFVRP